MDRQMDRQMPWLLFRRGAHGSLGLSLLFLDNGYRECLANGSWAARVNYSECQEILGGEVRLAKDAAVSLGGSAAPRGLVRALR